MSFPKNFVWGAGGVSYQMEGAASEDGRGLSVWDVFCRTPGKIWSGHSGAVACDHYHRYRDDVAAMKAIGLHAYRLSVSWPRVIPEGVGRVNPKGLGFYERLVDALLAAGITPYVTLFHWDYPYELYRRGGWLHSESPQWFADYVRVVVEKLADRVAHWITINEPQCFLGHGHHDGKHAPGDTLPFAEVLKAGHHVLLAHGKGVQVIRGHSKTKSQVGFAPVGMVRMPLTNAPEDVAAARQAMFSITQKSCWNNTWWMDPIFLGRYPDDGVEFFGNDVPHVHDGDMETICQPLDFFGVNIYGGARTRAGKDGQPEEVPRAVGHAQTALRWAVEPDSLSWGPKFYWERYKLPIVITENGMSNVDWVSLDGKVHDPQRIDFLGRYLLELRKACDEGVDVRGYFLWAFMDNFEWADGYKERFGILYVDYPTQRRVLKDSASWYKDVIVTNGACLGKAHAPDTT